jgi:hypothetical protein
MRNNNSGEKAREKCSNGARKGILERGIMQMVISNTAISVTRKSFEPVKNA